MPRRTFSAGTVTNTTGAPLRLTFHATSTTGRRETDLWTVDGSSNPAERIPNGVILTDASGAYSAFAGPDDCDLLWLQVGSSNASRTQLTASGTVAGGTTVDSNTYAPIGTGRLSPLVAVLGDSLAANTDTSTRRIDSPLHYASLISGGKIRYAYMGGVSGETSTQITARASAVVTSGAKACLIGMGTNDSNTTGPFSSVTRINLDAAVKVLLAGGVTPVFYTLPPRGKSGAAPSGAQQTFVATYNRYVRQQSLNIGVPLVDYYALFADITNDYYNSTYANDGIHPNTAGWIAMGQAISDALTPLLPGASILPVNNTDAASLIGNSLFQTNSGGIGTGWALSQGASGVTPTVVSATVGNKQRLTLSASAADYVIWVPNIAVTAGHVMQLVAKMSWSGVVPVLQIDTIISGATTFSAFRPVSQTPGPVTDGVVNFEFTVPASVDHVNVELVAKSGGTGTLDLGQCALYDRTALALV